MRYTITLNEDKSLDLVVNNQLAKDNPFVLEAYDGEAYLVEIILNNKEEGTSKVLTSRVLFGSGEPADEEEAG